MHRCVYPRFSLVAEDHFGAPVGAPNKVADEVGHGAGGHEQGGLLAEQLRRLGLQSLDGRVFTEDVVTHLRLVNTIKFRECPARVKPVAS